MSRIFFRSAISNLGRLTNSGASASLKSKGTLRVACQGLVRCDFRFVSSMKSSRVKELHKLNKILEKEMKFSCEPVDSRIGNFEVTRMEYAEVELKGRYRDEEIKINIEGSSGHSSYNPYLEEDLIIEISKDNGKNLHIECTIFGREIKNFAVVENDTKLTFRTSIDDILDDDIFKHLWNLLEERGINDEFFYKFEDWLHNYSKFNYMKIVGGFKNAIPEIKESPII